MTKRYKWCTIGVCLLALVGLLALVTVGYKFNLNQKEPEEEIVNSIDEVEEGIIGESDETAIDGDLLTELQEKQEARVGDLSIEPGSYAEDGKSRLSEEGKLEYTPGIDWSSGTISPDDLVTMLDFTASIIDQSLIKTGNFEDITFSKKDSDIEVSVEFPDSEALSQFSVPVFYYVKDGVLTMNVKLTIYNLSTKKQKEILAPVSMQYDIDALTLVE